ncbi:hypothetical protein ON010_g13804 [Phytophthora cinnamomi]|nr:hypothetical protein ON010_g13804 [Phytophthora cinnamomi]
MALRRLALVFPGQGSQRVGMGKDLLETWPRVVGDVLDEASEATKLRLRRLMTEGPADEPHAHARGSAGAAVHVGGGSARPAARDGAAARALCAGPFAGRVLGAGGGRFHRLRRCCAPRASPRLGHAASGGAWSRGHGRSDARASGGCRGAVPRGRSEHREGLPGGQLQLQQADGDQRRRRGRGRCHQPGQGHQEGSACSAAGCSGGVERRGGGDGQDARADRAGAGAAGGARCALERRRRLLRRQGRGPLPGTGRGRCARWPHPAANRQERRAGHELRHDGRDQGVPERAAARESAQSSRPRRGEDKNSVSLSLSHSLLLVLERRRLADLAGLEREARARGAAVAPLDHLRTCARSERLLPALPGEDLRVRLGRVGEAQVEHDGAAQHAHVSRVLPALALEHVRALSNRRERERERVTQDSSGPVRPGGQRKELEKEGSTHVVGQHGRLRHVRVGLGVGGEAAAGAASNGGQHRGEVALVSRDIVRRSGANAGQFYRDVRLDEKKVAHYGPGPPAQNMATARR